MRTENLAIEVKKYKDELILMKEQIYLYIEQSHLELKEAVSSFNIQIEKVAREVEFERLKLNSQNTEFRKFGLTVELANRRMSDIEAFFEDLTKNMV